MKQSEIEVFGNSKWENNYSMCCGRLFGILGSMVGDGGIMGHNSLSCQLSRKEHL
jgi:hypothetical protein